MKLSLYLLPLLAFAQAPTVQKVEPPNWWPAHSINPVRLLIRGSHLAGARLSGPLRTSALRLNPAGTYLFADVTIPPSAKPGSYPLTLTTPAGSTPVPFEILAPLSPDNHFQGISQDDFLYLAMPDRFSDGDPSNNNPPQSPGLFDPAKPRYYHGGDLQGLIHRLPYLQKLGVTALWLNPWYDNVNHLNTIETYDGQPITDYHGYGAVDYYAVEEHLGSLPKLRELVVKAHAAGIKIVQDQVANHTGPFHPWVQNPPLPNWFHGTQAAHLDENWLTWTVTDPRLPASARRSMLDGWFLNILPDLNQEEPEVARYLIQNTLWWIGVTGLDAIRQDTLPYVPRSFWRDWTAAIRKQYPRVNVVGEMFDGDPSLVAFFQGGRPQPDGIDSGIPMLFDFPLFYAIREAFRTGGSLLDLPKALAHDRLYHDPSQLVTFLGLHDVDRFTSPRRSPAHLKLALTFLLTTRGIPLLYYGDEIALPGGNDPDNRRTFPPALFDNPGPLYDHIAHLAQLRRRHDCLRRGALQFLETTPHRLVYTRRSPSCQAEIRLDLRTLEATVQVK